MAKSSKSVSQIKGHRTKAELDYRNKNELAVLSGCEIRELEDTAADPVAHIEFLRVAGYYVGMNKADAAYELAVNRYAQMRSREEVLKQRIKEEEGNYEVTDKLYQKLDVLQDRMFKMERDLLMTPAAALRAIPKVPPKETPEETLKDILGL